LCSRTFLATLPCVIFPPNIARAKSELGSLVFAVLFGLVVRPYVEDLIPAASEIFPISSRAQLYHTSGL